MPACPLGHASDDPQWCDVCGLAVAPPPPPPPSCAACGAELGGRFCEVCGQDSHEPVAPGGRPTAPVRAAPRCWEAVVRADRAWFEEVRRLHGGAGTLEFPRYPTERRFALTGAQVAIGRRSASRGTAPDIDLDGLDPGVSAAHALLVARPDGGWDLVDLDSTNGTTLVVADGPIPAQHPVPLPDGAVVHLGAWTTITVGTLPARQSR